MSNKDLVLITASWGKSCYQQLLIRKWACRGCVTGKERLLGSNLCFRSCVFNRYAMWNTYKARMGHYVKAPSRNIITMMALEMKTQ